MTFVSFMGLFTFYKKKTTKPSTQKIDWIRNELYDSNDSLSAIEGLQTLPDWLIDRKEMLFSSDSIVKGKPIGKGQFGNVYKGKYHQGNAV